ncbi:MAG: ribokinase [Nocardioidaceae bacterium]|nr:ribokinase [Nocardioidaceae bacterium]
MSAVAVVGSANADLVVLVDRRPDGGETVAGGDVATYPGGKGANQAAAAARSGADVVMCGCIGSDEHGRLLADALSSAGADVSHLERGDRPTGVALILVTPDGENSIVVAPGANASVTPELADRHRAAWVDADVVVLNLEVPLTTVTQVATSAQGRVVLNAAPAAAIDPALLALCDPLVVNEHEARTVLGSPDGTYDEVAAQLIAAGARSVVVTLGAEGAVVASADGVVRLAAHRVEAVDTTGAGDAFVGALAAELAAGRSLADAASYAGAMAAISVQRPGAQASYPDRADVLALLTRQDGAHA